jgi:hypothetical protein
MVVANTYGDPVSLADPEAALRVVAEYIGFLEQSKVLWTDGHQLAGNDWRVFMGDRYDAADIEILSRHAQVAAIAEVVRPDLVDLIRMRVHTDPSLWRYQPTLVQAYILRGALERLDETEKIVGARTRRLSTPEQRSRYGLALLEHGAVLPHTEASRDIGDELGFSDDVLDDVESWLAGAKLILIVASGPQVALTHAGRKWAEEGAPLDKPPAGSNTIVINIGDGATVGAIQAAGHGAQQSAEVLVVNTDAAVRDWVESVRELLKQESERNQVYVESRLDEVDEALQDNDPSRLRRGLSWVLGGLRKIGWGAAGSMTGAALMVEGEHLLHLIH